MEVFLKLTWFDLQATFSFHLRLLSDKNHFLPLSLVMIWQVSIKGHLYTTSTFAYNGNIPNNQIHPFICLIKVQLFNTGDNMENTHARLTFLSPFEDFQKKVKSKENPSLISQKLRSCEDDPFSVPVRHWQV